MPQGTAWLRQLPAAVADLAARWSLDFGKPYHGDDVTAAWVAPVTRPDGERAVLKLGMPHMEAKHELHGMRFWNGDPTARLLDFDEGLNAMLLEECRPGTALKTLPEPEQDIVIAELLRRLWRVPGGHLPFRPLSTMLAAWSRETELDRQAWPDAGLVREGLRLFTHLANTAPTTVLLATDLHAGNVLRAEREPWLVIDPKPFMGDPAYDATQHLLNCPARLRSDPVSTIDGFAERLEIDAERIQLWLFARAAAEPREEWSADHWRWPLARALAP